MTGEQDGWNAKGIRVFRGRKVEEDLGHFENLPDAFAASDEYHRKHKNSITVEFERNYREPNEDE